MRYLRRSLVIPVLPFVSAIAIEAGFGSTGSAVVTPCGDELVVKNGYVYVSFEWSFVVDGAPSRLTSSANDVEVVSPNMLNETASLVEKRWSGEMSLACSAGVPIIVPSPSRTISHHTQSALDTHVTLEVETVSTWEALKKLVREVNASPSAGVTLKLLFYQYCPSVDPPDSFLSEQTISLAVRDVPAREALCLILAQSPAQICFEYYNLEGKVDGTSLNQSVLWISFYKDKALLGPLDSDDLAVKWWSNEIREANHLSPEVLAKHAVNEEIVP